MRFLEKWLDRNLYIPLMIPHMGGGGGGVGGGGSMSPVNSMKWQFLISLSLMSISQVEFKIYSRHMSLYFGKPCRMSMGRVQKIAVEKQQAIPLVEDFTLSR